MSDRVSRQLTLDLRTPRRVHVLNVGGSGMSAIATLLAQGGHEVSGVDDNETPFVGPLRATGIDVVVGTPGPLPSDVDVVVTSTATPESHPHVTAAIDRSIPVVHRAPVLEQLCGQRTVTAVSGTHGKTTTTAMLATIHEHAGTGAGFLVASTITGLGCSAAWRTGPLLVVEADESDGTFLRCNATTAVVTNLEADHLSYWKTEEALVAGFRQFVGDSPGASVLCLDDPGAAALVSYATRPVTYGTDPGAEYHITDVRPHEIGVAFTLSHEGRSVPVRVPMAPGIHNARNAAAAMAAAAQHGVDIQTAAKALAGFAGVARRFEHMGAIDGITFVDSYDHLPTEVAAALAAARSGPFERVVCVFQPHRYTRTRDLWQTFADCFEDADVLAVCGLYTAGEQPIDGVTGELIADAVRSAHPGQTVHWLPDLDAAHDWLVGELRAGDLCLTLNVGDLRTVPARVIDTLAAP